MTYIVDDDQGHDSNHVNGIIDLADKWIGVNTVIPIMGLKGSMDRV